MKKKNQIIWTVITVLLAAVSILSVLSYSKEITFSDLLDVLAGAKKKLLFWAALCMFGYIWFEAEAIYCLLRESGYKKKQGEVLVYSAADIYCSAITPSATGGQPVCAWFMARDGVPVGVASALLLVFLIMHTLATMTLGLVCLFMDPSVFLGFSILSKLLILLGYLALAGITAFFIILLSKAEWIFKKGAQVIGWLHKKNIIKRKEYWTDRYRKVITDYSDSVGLMKSNGYMLFAIYELNLLQRLVQQLVTPLVYLATGGVTKNAVPVFVTQVFSAIGSMWVPVPGGMGFADYLLIDGLHAVLDKQEAIQLELLSRGLSFYVCVLVSLLIVLIGYIHRRRLYFSFRMKR